MPKVVQCEKRVEVKNSHSGYTGEGKTQRER